MSYEAQATIPNAPGQIQKGRSNVKTTTTVDVGVGGGTIKLAVTGQKPAARDVTLRSTMSLAEARALRNELDAAIGRVE